jgi:hypothetical protein
LLRSAERRCCSTPGRARAVYPKASTAETPDRCSGVALALRTFAPSCCASAAGSLVRSKVASAGRSRTFPVSPKRRCRGARFGRIRLSLCRGGARFDLAAARPRGCGSVDGPGLAALAFRPNQSCDRARSRRLRSLGRAIQCRGRGPLGADRAKRFPNGCASHRHESRRRWSCAGAFRVFVRRCV